MATIIKLHEKSPEEKAEEWISSVPDKFLGCIAFGHAFPKLKSGYKGKVIKGITLRRFSDGSRELEMICRDCGTVRTIVAEPGAVIEFPTKRYIYGRPKGYSRPKGTFKLLPKRACANECARRWEEEQTVTTDVEKLARAFTPNFSGR